MEKYVNRERAFTKFLLCSGWMNGRERESERERGGEAWFRTWMCVGRQESAARQRSCCSIILWLFRWAMGFLAMSPPRELYNGLNARGILISDTGFFLLFFSLFWGSKIATFIGGTSICRLILIEKLEKVGGRGYWLTWAVLYLLPLKSVNFLLNFIHFGLFRFNSWQLIFRALLPFEIVRYAKRYKCEEFVDCQSNYSRFE